MRRSLKDEASHAEALTTLVELAAQSWRTRLTRITTTEGAHLRIFTSQVRTTTGAVDQVLERTTREGVQTPPGRATVAPSPVLLLGRRK